MRVSTGSMPLSLVGGDDRPRDDPELSDGEYQHNGVDRVSANAHYAHVVQDVKYPCQIDRRYVRQDRQEHQCNGVRVLVENT